MGCKQSTLAHSESDPAAKGQQDEDTVTAAGGAETATPHASNTASPDLVHVDTQGANKSEAGTSTHAATAEPTSSLSQFLHHGSTSGHGTQDPNAASSGHSETPSKPTSSTLDDLLDQFDAAPSPGMGGQAPFDWKSGEVMVQQCAALTHIGAGAPPIKDENQDCVVCEPSFGNLQHCSLLGIFDGHGGRGFKCADWVSREFPKRILAACKQDLHPHEAVADSFLDMHRELESGVCGDMTFSGTTATTALVVGRKLFMGWVGDSQAVLVYKSGATTILTRDHRPDDPKERERITAAGGVVSQKILNGNPVGPLRVWHTTQPLPGLMVSRSIGDVYAHALGVSALPELTEHELTGEEAWIVIGSDGVWDVLSDADVGSVVGNCRDVASAAHAIVDAALEGWNSRVGADNISCSVARML